MRTKRDWIKHIENWQQSGLTQAAYCRQHDLIYQHFTAQLAAYRKIAKKAKHAVTPQAQLTTFIPVKVDSSVDAKSVVLSDLPDSRTSERMVFCHSHGHRLELPLSVSAAWMAELLRCLA